MASTSDKFEMPIRPLELRRSENKCSSGYDISMVALHVNDGTTAQMFGFFGGARRNQMGKEQTARLSWGRWRNYLLAEVKSVAVEEWLGKLPMAAGTKAKLRNIMSAIFHHAMRHEWTEKNPISLVRQSAKREAIPGVLDLAEIRALLAELKHPYKQMVFLAAATGLRASELL